MDDRAFWMTVRAALLMFVRAIEKRYNIGNSSVVSVTADTIASAAMYEQKGN